MAAWPCAAGGTGETCGVATSLEVTFGCGGGPGPVAFAVEVPLLGGRLAVASAVVTDAKGRLVARGTVTKYGRFKG